MKRLQVIIKKETHDRITEIIAKCNEGFEDGVVTTQDVVDSLLSSATYDVQKIRSRCLNPHKIKANARLEFKSDVDELIKKLALIKPLLKESEVK